MSKKLQVFFIAVFGIIFAGAEAVAAHVRKPAVGVS